MTQQRWGFKSEHSGRKIDSFVDEAAHLRSANRPLVGSKTLFAIRWTNNNNQNGINFNEQVANWRLAVVSEGTRLADRI